MTFDSLFQIRKFAGQFLVKRERLAKANEGAHDGDVDLNDCATRRSPASIATPCSA